MDEPSHEKSFWKGFLAHLILVPSWTLAPPVLLGSASLVGRAHGRAGVALGAGLAAGLPATYNMWQRSPMLLALHAMALTAPAAERWLSACASLLASVLAWMCKGGRGDFARRPWLYNFLCRRAKDFYDAAELRGSLASIESRKSCFAFHPHGCLAAGFSINGVYSPSFVGAAGKVHFLIDRVLRHTNPFFRMLCDSIANEHLDIDTTEKATFLKHLRNGESIAFIPGGFQDAVAHSYGADCTVLRKRKGFVKYCLQYGYRLHPVYTFGECSTYHASAWFRKLRMWISEFNIPMVLFFGWPLMPLLPRPQAKLITYVGPALELPKIEEPSKQDIDKWHAMYLEALQKLFDENRAEAGWPDAKLEIL